MEGKTKSAARGVPFLMAADNGGKGVMVEEKRSA